MADKSIVDKLLTNRGTPLVVGFTAEQAAVLGAVLEHALRSGKLSPRIRSLLDDCQMSLALAVAVAAGIDPADFEGCDLVSGEVPK